MMHRFFWFIAGETIAQRTGCLWDFLIAVQCTITRLRRS